MRGTVDVAYPRKATTLNSTVVVAGRRATLNIFQTEHAMRVCVCRATHVASMIAAG